MNRAVGAGLLVVGILLVVLGVNAADSLSSEFSEFFQGTPTNRAIWMLLGGALLAVLGLFAMARGKRA